MKNLIFFAQFIIIILTDLLVFLIDAIVFIKCPMCLVKCKLYTLLNGIVYFVFVFFFIYGYCIEIIGWFVS